MFRFLAKVFPNWCLAHRYLVTHYWTQNRLEEAIPHFESVCRLSPNDHQALIDYVQLLNQAGRDRDIGASLSAHSYRISRFWHFLGRYVQPRYDADGTVSNMTTLGFVFRIPIRRSLAFMDSMRLRAELLVAMAGDESGFVQLLATRHAAQNDLISCLGLTDAPVRYMTNYWVRKIGHLAQIEFYYKAMTLGILRPRRVVILCSDKSEVANLCLLEYWERYFTVIVDPLKSQRLSLEAKILNADIHLFERAEGDPTYIYHKQATALAWARWEGEKRPPLFSIKAEHRARGWDALESIGIRRGSWFVTIHVRESGFSDDQGSSPRNAALDRYLPAMREVVARGGYVIRIGDKGMKKLAELPGIIDYPHTDLKSDWMDIFLLAESKCFVGVASGPAGVPPLFGVPCVYTNWMPLGDYPYNGSALLVHKTHRDRLTGKKAAYSRFASICTDQEPALKSANISIEDNLPEEISDVLIEMLDALDGKTQIDVINEGRQARFREIAGMATGVGRPKLGRRFLESNADILN